MKINTQGKISPIKRYIRSLFTIPVQKTPPVREKSEVLVTTKVAIQRFQDHTYGRQKNSPTIDFQDAAKKLGLIICDPECPVFYRGEAIPKLTENETFNEHDILELAKDTSITDNLDIAHSFASRTTLNHLKKTKQQTNLSLLDIKKSLTHYVFNILIPRDFPIIKIPNDIPHPASEKEPYEEDEYILPKGTLIKASHLYQHKRHRTHLISITVLSLKEAQAYRDNLPQ